MGVCNCSIFCCTLFYVHSSIAIILMGKRVLIALLNLSSWCLVMDERLFLAVPRGCLQFVNVVFPDHTHLLFLLWIHSGIQTSDLFILDFKPLERKDRTGDRHGGVMIYVKDSLFYKRRYDLEPRYTECIWIEI